MTTGYTVVVEEGGTWEEFVWRCARAMGPLIAMRDDALDKPAPKEFKPEKRYQKELDEALVALEKAKGLSMGEADRQAEREFNRLVAEVKKGNAKTEEQRNRFLTMVAKTSAWSPPENYRPLKEFMLQQLNQELHYLTPTKLPERQSGKAWKEKHVAYAERDVEYAREHLEDDSKRVAFQNQWLAGLRASVPQPKKR